jgi:hypothetical protein
MDGSRLDAATLGLKYNASIIVKVLERTHRKRTVVRTPTWLRPPDMEPALQIAFRISCQASRGLDLIGSDVAWPHQPRGTFSDQLSERARIFGSARYQRMRGAFCFGLVRFRPHLRQLAADGATVTQCRHFPSPNFRAAQPARPQPKVHYGNTVRNTARRGTRRN